MTMQKCSSKSKILMKREVPNLVKYFSLLICWVFLFQHGLVAQIDNSKTYTLDSVFVKIGRLENPLLSEPKAVSSLQLSKIQYAKQQLSINEYLEEIPSLFALNPHNFAQDLRVSIRGFGARAAFGIRGVKILVDGIPETTADGQGQTDNLDLGLMESIEVLRGPSSGLYGNASGGVISISTQSEVEQNFLEAGTTFGSNTLQRYQLKAGIKAGNTNILLNGMYNQLDGFRLHSGLRHTTLSANILHEFSEKTQLKFILNYTNSPRADDPGGVNLESLEIDRTAPSDRHLFYEAGESVAQFKAASILNIGDFETKVFFINRDFYGKLPFNFGGIIDLNRNFFGHSSTYKFNAQNQQFTNHLLLGYDLQRQQDNRQRFRNEKSIEGEQVFHQEENFTNLGLFLTEQFIFQQWNINANLRYDWNQLEANDLALDNGDASGTIQLNALNGGLGIGFKVNPTLLPYARFSTSFETPTLSELSANPTGDEGFNEELKAQRAINLEFGAKGLVAQQLQYELSLFQIQTTNEILPFEIEAFPDRDFFRNAGKTQRLGIETALKYAPNKQWQVAANYTFSDFRFTDYNVKGNILDGEKLPGLPTHFGAASLRYIHPKGAFFKLTTQQIGKLFVNDTNSIEVEDYTIVNLNLGFEKTYKNLKWIPFFGVNNLLNQEYNSNIRINAFGGRFYEAAPGINVFGGLRLRLE